jgi:hypothetical protein
MKYSEVIHDAWELTQNAPKLKWFAFVPGFVAVLIFVLEVAWQLYWYSAEFGLFSKSLPVGEALSQSFRFLVDHHLIVWAIIVALFFIVFAFVLPAWITGTMILGVRHRFEMPDQYFSLRQKMIEGFSYFFKLFELKAILAPFQFLSIVFFAATFYRVFHDSFFSVFSPVIIIYFVVAFFINIFFAFAPFFLVCENRDLGSSIKGSMGLVFLNFGRTLSVVLLMFLVNFRIIVNVVVVLGVPLGVLFAVSYFASGVAIFLSVLLGVVAIALAAYLTAIIEVFSIAVWERTFVTLREEQQAVASKQFTDEEGT